MSSHVGNIMEQNLAQLGQSGVIAQNNFITFSKAQDYDYLENKNISTQIQAMGLREVASRTVPAGPTPN